MNTSKISKIFLICNSYSKNLIKFIFYLHIMLQNCKIYYHLKEQMHFILNILHLLEKLGKEKNLKIPP